MGIRQRVYRSYIRHPADRKIKIKSVAARRVGSKSKRKPY